MEPSCPDQYTLCFPSFHNVAMELTFGPQHATLLPGQMVELEHHTAFLFSSWEADMSEMYCDDVAGSGSLYLVLHNDLLPGEAACEAKGF